MKNMPYFGVTKPMGTSFKKLMSKIRNNSIDHVELYMMPSLKKENFRELRKAGIKFQIHEIPTNPLHSCFKIDKEQLINKIREYIMILHEFEGKQLILHPPQWNSQDDPHVIEGFEEGMNSIYDYANDNGVLITLELLEGFYYSQFRYFEKKNNWKNLQLTYDLRRSPVHGRKTEPFHVFDDFGKFAHRISNIHTFYIGMGKNVRGGIGSIPKIERTTNFKKLISIIKFLKWNEAITCENPNVDIAVEMTKKSKLIYEKTKFK